MIRLKIAEILKEHEFSKRFFSEISGIPKSTLHLLCSNKASSIRMQDLEIFCELTGRPPGEFFEYKFTEEPLNKKRIKNRGRKKRKGSGHAT